MHSLWHHKILNLNRCKETILLQLYCCCRQHCGIQIAAALAVMLLHATFWSVCFFMRHKSKVAACIPRWKVTLGPHNVAGESRMQSTTRVRPTAKCAAHIIFGEAAGLWLPKSCRQQYFGCHNVAPAARLKQGQQDYGNQNVAGSSILAATILLSAVLWQNILP